MPSQTKLTLDGRQDTENQLRQLRAFAETQGCPIIHEHVDLASGKRSDREQFQRMFTAASKREFDCLLFWSLDRLSREGTVDTLNHLLRLTDYGANYRSFTEQYLDSTGIFKEAVIGILAAVAKQERVRLSERTIAGLLRAKAQGRIGGHPKAEDTEPMLVAKIVRLRSHGQSIRAIAAEIVDVMTHADGPGTLYRAEPNVKLPGLDSMTADDVKKTIDTVVPDRARARSLADVCRY